MKGKLVLLYVDIVGTSDSATAILSKMIPKDFATYKLEPDKKLIPIYGPLS